MLIYTNRKKNTHQKVRFQQQASESQQQPQPIIAWNTDGGDTVSVPLKVRPPKKRKSNNHLQVINNKRRYPKDYSFESSMNSYDESKQIELASSSNSIQSSPSMQPEVHNSSKLRSEYDQLTANMDRELVLFGYDKTRKYTTEGTETDNVTEYESTEYDEDMSVRIQMETKTTTKGGKNGKHMPEMKMLTSMGFDKELAYVALMQSNYNVPKAIHYLIHSEQMSNNGQTKK